MHPLEDVEFQLVFGHERRRVLPHLDAGDLVGDPGVESIVGEQDAGVGPASARWAPGVPTLARVARARSTPNPIGRQGRSAAGLVSGRRGGRRGIVIVVFEAILAV